MESVASLNNRRRSSVQNGTMGTGLPSHGMHESLIAVCMLIVATLALGIMLYALRDILIPLAFSILFYYVLQPVVNFLTKPPAVCCSDLCKDSEDSDDEDELSVRRLLGWLGKKKGKSSYKYGSVEEGLPIQTEGASKSWRPISTPEGGNHDRQSSGRQSGSTSAGSRGRQAALRLLFSLRCPRWLAIILAISLAIGAFVVFGMMIYSAIITVENDWPTYEAGAEKGAQQLKAWLAKLHVSLDDDLVPYVMDAAKSYIPRLITGVWLVIANGLLVSIFLLYLLSTPPQPMPPGVWRKIDVHIRRYIRIKTFICLVISLLVFIILSLLHVPFAGLFGFITFVLNFIPNFGPIMATVLPLPLVVFHPGLSVQSKILAFVLPSIGHFFCGYWLEPRVFGEHLELHPIIILVALAFWGVLWGVVGMILSVPLISLIKIISQHLDHPYARTIVRVLEGRMIDFDVEASITAYQNSGGSHSPVLQARED